MPRKQPPQKIQAVPPAPSLALVSDFDTAEPETAKQALEVLRQPAEPPPDFTADVHAAACNLGIPMNLVAGENGYDYSNARRDAQTFSENPLGEILVCQTLQAEEFGRLIRRSRPTP
jgi:hypothetical protein